MSDALAGRVDDLEETVYKGNGRPSLVVRAEVSEKRLDAVEKTQSRWEGIAGKLLWSAIASITGLLLHLAIEYGAKILTIYR